MVVGPLSHDGRVGGFSRVPGLRSPTPPGVAPASAAGNSVSPASSRESQDCACNASRAPLRVPDSRARTPPPPRRRGATAHVSPPAHSALSLKLPEPEDPERVGPGRGKGPGRIHFPLPMGGVRRRAAAPSPASRFLERSAEITPSPLGADLGTWAGPRPLPTPRRPSKNLVPQTKFGDPNPARGQPLLTSRVERTQATPPVRSWRGEGEGTLRSPPGHSLLKRAPLWFAGSR